MSCQLINSFLTNVRQKMANQCATSAVHVVLGNESCDLDSAISALVYGLMIAEETKANDDKNVAVLPVLNIPKADVPLKTEVVYFLKENCIHYEKIPCRDEVDLKALQKEGKLHLNLVDHHQLTEDDRPLISSIARILDHRAVVSEALAVLPSKAQPIIKPVGSCCTLVAEELRSRAPHLLTNCVARLLKGTILLDTVCFSVEAGRTTPLDIKAVEECEKSERLEIFQTLVNARKDIAALTPSQLLRKDVKVVEGLPIPGLPELVADFVKRDGAAEALNEMCTKHQSSAAVIIGMIIDGTSGAVTRDVAVFNVAGRELGERICSRLSSEKFLELRPVDCNLQNVTLYSQGNVKATRKHILPVVQSVLV